VEAFEDLATELLFAFVFLASVFLKQFAIQMIHLVKLYILTTLCKLICGGGGDDDVNGKCLIGHCS